MLYEESLSRCRKPFAKGSSRHVYYSRKYNLVFKVEMECPCFYGQTEREEAFYNEVPVKYRPLFPVVDFVTYNGKRWEILRKVETAYSLGITCWLDRELQYDKTGLRKKIEEKIQKPVPNFDLVKEFLRFYKIPDLHSHNWGIDQDGNIQIIDWGL